MSGSCLASFDTNMRVDTLKDYLLPGQLGAVLLFQRRRFLKKFMMTDHIKKVHVALPVG
jgi:hypothetical protein